MICFIAANPLGPLFALAHTLLGRSMISKRVLVDWRKPSARWVSARIVEVLVDWLFALAHNLLGMRMTGKREPSARWVSAWVWNKR